MDFTNKTKTKIIALLSSIILWLYVTTVVDPLETRTFKDIPITISNTHLIKEKSLTIFPEESISANITVKTNLSKLKKLTKDNLIIYGSISNPMPGKNIITLSSNLPDNIRHDIEPTTSIINLEVLETITKDVTVIANKKYTTENYEITIDKESIELSGTKTLINKIDKIIGTVKTNSTENNFTEKLELIPIDKNGNKVENIKLSDKYITVTVNEIVTETNSLDEDSPLEENEEQSENQNKTN